jgi:hypothetical protein
MDSVNLLFGVPCSGCGGVGCVDRDWLIPSGSDRIRNKVCVLLMLRGLPGRCCCVHFGQQGVSCVRRLLLGIAVKFFPCCALHLLWLCNTGALTQCPQRKTEQFLFKLMANTICTTTWHYALSLAAVKVFVQHEHVYTP